MIYPGYLLNPGDMFSVEPERVLFATGDGKRRKQVGGAKKAAADGEEAEAEAEAQEEVNTEEAEAKESELKVAETEAAVDEAKTAITPQAAKRALLNLIFRAKDITKTAKGDLSGRRLRELRQLTKDFRKTMSKFGSRNSDADANLTIEELTKSLDEIRAKIPETSLPASETTKSSESDASTSEEQQVKKFDPKEDAVMLQQALQRARENPVDHSKPYRTPWRPRNYMSAFAFIPRYLEVNQNICSAVYLRHPVARPGLAEVPTPLNAEAMGLAFNWYLRRR